MNEEQLQKDHDMIVRHDEKLDAIQADINTIMTNHLVHIASDIKEISESIGRINVKLALWSGGIVVVVWMLEHFIK